MATANIYQVADFDDPRVGPYRNLKDRELAVLGGLFIAEGEHVVRRLLESGVETQSVLVAERKLETMRSAVPESVPLLVAPNAMVDGIVGFNVHTGVMAVGVRPTSTGVDDVMQTPAARGPRAVLVICPEVINTDNMGSLIRVSAALGAAGMLVGERSCDPYFRRSVRVSMGTVFRLPIVRSPDLLADLLRLKEKWGVELIATVVDEPAQPLSGVCCAGRVGLMFGSEAQGLHRRWLAVADRRVTIPMHWGTDSLNVAVAAGVVLYQVTKEGDGG